MKIVVFVKQAINVDLKIRVKDDGTIQEDALEYVISACDECAIEEAVRIKEKNRGSEVTLVCLGPARAARAIRRGLSLGADNAIHLLVDAYNSNDATANARIFAGVLNAISFDVAFFGKQAQDTDMQATAEILSELMGLPMASNCVQVSVRAGTAVVHRQSDRCLEVIELGTPCIISVNNDINNPRYPSLGSIMAARIRPVAVKKPADFGVGDEQFGREGSLIERLKYETPRPRKAGTMFEGDAAEITNRVIGLLAAEARVIG